MTMLSMFCTLSVLIFLLWTVQSMFCTVFEYHKPNLSPCFLVIIVDSITFMLEIILQLSVQSMFCTLSVMTFFFTLSQRHYASWSTVVWLFWLSLTLKNVRSCCISNNWELSHRIEFWNCIVCILLCNSFF